MRPILTIWEITDPNKNPDHYIDEDVRFYRWTFQYYGIFVTSETEYMYSGHCERRGLEWVHKHDYKSPDVKYDDRTNVEFLA